MQQSELRQTSSKVLVVRIMLSSGEVGLALLFKVTISSQALMQHIQFFFFNLGPTILLAAKPSHLH